MKISHNLYTAIMGSHYKFHSFHYLKLINIIAINILFI